MTMLTAATFEPLRHAPVTVAAHPSLPELVGHAGVVVGYEGSLLLVRMNDDAPCGRQLPLGFAPGELHGLPAA